MESLQNTRTRDGKVSTEALLELIKEQLEDRKGEDLVILDMRELSSVTDYFVIVSGNSSPHLRAMAEQTENNLKKQSQKVFRMAGDNFSGWFVLDYVDVVVHIMSYDARKKL